ncbi:hypothetical protein ES703_68946 [subsurface metagenome]
MSPFAKHAAEASAGISSIMSGISTPPTVVPFRQELFTRMFPSGSGKSPLNSTLISPPILLKTSRICALVRFRRTFCRIISDEGETRAEAIKNTADDISPGIVISSGVSSFLPEIIILFPWIRCLFLISPSIKTSIRSV